MASLGSDIGRIVPHLRRFARTLVHGHNVRFADDLVQETIVLMLRSERRQSASLLVSCLSTLIRVHRLRCRQEAREQQESKAADGSRVGGLAQVVGGGSGQGVGHLDAIALESREVLLLVVLAGLSYAQVADALGLTPDLVMARLTAARDALAKAGMGPAGSVGGRAGERGRGPGRPAPAHLRVVK